MRSADPCYEARRDSLVWRLGPDCNRIDIDRLVHHQDLASLLYCTGQETANIHLVTPKGRKRIRKSWDHLSTGGLETAAQSKGPFVFTSDDQRRTSLVAHGRFVVLPCALNGSTTCQGFDLTPWHDKC